MNHNTPSSLAKAAAGGSQHPAPTSLPTDGARPALPPWLSLEMLRQPFYPRGMDYSLAAAQLASTTPGLSPFHAHHHPAPHLIASYQPYLHGSYPSMARLPHFIDPSHYLSTTRQRANLFGSRMAQAPSTQPTPNAFERSMSASDGLLWPPKLLRAGPAAAAATLPLTPAVASAANDAANSLLARRRSETPTTAPQPPSALPTQPYYPSHFMRGTVIQLASGDLKRVEELNTEDFIRSADLSSDLKMDSSTVVRIEDKSKDTVLLCFSVGEHKVQVSVEATVEHPFFVIGQGWSSCNQERTRNLYGLPCQRLQVGDICISLTHRDVCRNLPKAPPPLPSPTQQSAPPPPPLPGRPKPSRSLPARGQRRAASPTASERRPAAPKRRWSSAE